MKVLLIGATGLLGHNVLQRLTDHGHEAVALVRHSNALCIKTPGTVLVEGNATQLETLSAAAKGCDAIVNCAGVTDMSLLSRDDYTEVNVTLCEDIVSVMNTHGIRRLVHVSTVNTIGYGDADHPADEHMTIKPPFDKSYYADSKLCGEKIVRAAAAGNPDWHVVVVNPGYMIGPMDVKPSSGRMLLMGYRKPLMFAPRGGKSFVDVRDVAAAVVNALTMGRSGDRYIAVNSAEQFPISQLYRRQATVMGYRQVVLSLPNVLLSVAGRVGDTLRLLGVRTELSTRNVRQLMVCEYYDNSHAVSELHMPLTPIDHSIRDFYAWRKSQPETKK